MAHSDHGCHADGLPAYELDGDILQAMFATYATSAVWLGTAPLYRRWATPGSWRWRP